HRTHIPNISDPQTGTCPGAPLQVSRRFPKSRVGSRECDGACFFAIVPKPASPSDPHPLLQDTATPEEPAEAFECWSAASSAASSGSLRVVLASSAQSASLERPLFRPP